MHSKMPSSSGCIILGTTKKENTLLKMTAYGSQEESWFADIKT